MESQRNKLAFKPDATRSDSRAKGMPATEDEWRVDIALGDAGPQEEHPGLAELDPAWVSATLAPTPEPAPERSEELPQAPSPRAWRRGDSGDR
jgi:hypothetical protein